MLARSPISACERGEEWPSRGRVRVAGAESGAFAFCANVSTRESIRDCMNRCLAHVNSSFEGASARISASPVICALGGREPVESRASGRGQYSEARQEGENGQSTGNASPFRNVEIHSR